MRLIAEPLRSHRTLERFASMLASLALAAYLITHLFLPLPLNQWIAGMVCFTSDRVASGGHFYESPESLCGATFPYPPGSLFAQHWLIRMTGLDLLLATRLMSIALTALYSVLCIRVAIRLGASWAFAASSFALACYALSLHVSYGGGWTLAGDLVVLASAMAIVLRAPAFEQSKAGLFVAFLLALALLFKAQGASLYVGVALFLVSRPQIAPSRKLYSFTCMGVGLLAVVAILIFLPNCWVACVDSMRKHPRSLARLTRDLAESKYLWPFGVLPAFLVILNLKRFSLARGWRGFQSLPASTAMLICLTPPYVAIQAAAMMKNGGGAYDMDLAILLAMPLIVLAGKLCGFDSWPAVVVLAILAVTGLARSTLDSLQDISHGARVIEESRTYLTAKYSHAKVLYSADQYCLIGGTSLAPETDVWTVWHYLTAGKRLEKVMEALQTQHYDLLIYPGLFGDSVPFEAFDKLLREKYVPVVDEKIPAYLRGGLFVRRQAPE